MSHQKIGAQMATVGLLTDVDTSKRNVLGTRARDEAGNEYVYLQGAANTVAGDWVFIDDDYTTVRAVTSSIFGPMAIAMAATVASTYGWYQIYGVATGNHINDTLLDDHQVYISATPGQVDDDSGTGQTIYNAISRSTSNSTSDTFWISYPFCLGTAPA